MSKSTCLPRSCKGAQWDNNGKGKLWNLLRPLQGNSLFGPGKCSESAFLMKWVSICLGFQVRLQCAMTSHECLGPAGRGQTPLKALTMLTSTGQHLHQTGDTEFLSETSSTLLPGAIETKLQMRKLMLRASHLPDQVAHKLASDRAGSHPNMQDS